MEANTHARTRSFVRTPAFVSRHGRKANRMWPESRDRRASASVQSRLQERSSAAQRVATSRLARAPTCRQSGRASVLFARARSGANVSIGRLTAPPPSEGFPGTLRAGSSPKCAREGKRGPAGRVRFDGSRARPGGVTRSTAAIRTSFSQTAIWRSNTSA